MAAKTSALSPLRYATPGQLIICIILFFLPWLEVQCNSQKEKMAFDMPKAGAKGETPKSTAPTWVTFASQSGMQAASGGVTFLGNQPGMNDKTGPGGKEAAPGKDSGSAPLLWLYPLAIVGGVVVGFAMPSTKQRKLILAACCGVAFLVPTLQAVIGFPIEKAIEKDLKEGLGNMGGGMADPMTPPGSKKTDAKTDAKAEMKKQLDDALKDAFRVSYQFWFYLALILPLGGLITALIEPVGPPRGKKPLYDLEDEDEDEDEDERPKRRRRRDEDDEEDEPKPRRRRLDDDDEDEPKPRRNRDVELDDDEPKPRRKRLDLDEDEPKPRRKEGKPDRGDKGRDKGGKPGKRPAPDDSDDE